MDKKFSLEHQYQLYLKRCNITEAQMHPVQRKETKQAFFGACGQLLVLFRDDIGDIENENEAVQVMEDLFDQVTQYFLEITKN